MYSNLVLLFSFVFACFCCVFAIPTLNRLTVHPGDREYVPPQCGGDQDSGYGNICVNDTHCGPEGKCVYIYMVYACLCHQCKASPEGCCPKQVRGLDIAIRKIIQRDYKKYCEGNCDLLYVSRGSNELKN